MGKQWDFNYQPQLQDSFQKVTGHGVATGTHGRNRYAASAHALRIGRPNGLVALWLEMLLLLLLEEEGARGGLNKPDFKHTTWMPVTTRRPYL